MRKKLTMKGLICLVVLSSALFCTACGSDSDSEDSPNVKSININISIDYPEKAKKPDLKTLPFRVEEETSVMQAVELYGNVNNTSILIDTTYSTLEGVDGVINDVTLKTGTWYCRINGETLDKPVSDVILKDGDHLELIYTKEKTIE